MKKKNQNIYNPQRHPWSHFLSHFYKPPLLAHCLFVPQIQRAMPTHKAKSRLHYNHLHRSSCKKNNPTAIDFNNFSLFQVDRWMSVTLKFLSKLLIASLNGKEASRQTETSFGCVQFHGFPISGMKLTCTPLT